MNRSLETCPACGGPLEIREFACTACDVTIRGHFPLVSRGPFARLTDDQLAFLHLFVTSRGNMSDVERSLGVSYPTVRAKLDDLIAALTDEAPEQAAHHAGMNRDEIFDRVSRGEITVDDAMAMLDALSSSNS